MKSTPTLLPALAFVGAVLSSTPVPAATEPFVRLLAIHAEPVDEGLDGAVGGLAQLGATYDEGDAMLELGHVQFDQDDAINIGGVDYLIDGDLRVTPILFTARWRLPITREGPLAFLVGITGGLSELRASGSATVAGDTEPIGSVSESKWLWTYGADAGVRIRIDSRFHLSVGYKYVALAESTWNVEGARVDIDDIEAHVIYGGIGWRF